MAAPKGNRFWLARTKHGRDGKFKDGEELMNACLEYMKWNADNPLWEKKLITYQGEGTLIDVPKARAMSKGGLCNFLGIHTSTWYDWEKPDNTQGFSGIVARVNEMIRQQKFEGGMAEQFNPMMVARDLGMKETTDNNHRSEDGTMSPAKIDEDLVSALVDKLTS